jgi:molybdenum cofactor cytidylyltransferase
VKIKPSAAESTPQRLEAIVLAAGAGSRFGGGKLLAPWRSGVLLDGAMAAAFAAPVGTVWLATGADGAAVWAAGQAFAERQGVGQRLRHVPVEAWREGLSASLKAAIAALPADTDAAFVFLGDMPRIPYGLAAQLAAALTEADAAIPEVDGALGHPALIATQLFPRLADLSGDRGARALLEGLGTRLARVPTTDSGVLFDVDTREALAEA